MTEEDQETVTETPSPVLPVAQPVGNLVEITITKKGDGKVSTGIHVAGEGDIFAARGDKLLVSREIVASLEDRGFAEAD